jgi:hypothetical protein
MCKRNAYFTLPYAIAVQKWKRPVFSHRQKYKRVPTRVAVFNLHANISLSPPPSPLSLFQVVLSYTLFIENALVEIAKHELHENVLLTFHIISSSFYFLQTMLWSSLPHHRYRWSKLRPIFYRLLLTAFKLRFEEGF